METLKIKMKVGEHEFEAEGPIDVVQSQFALFKELITLVPKVAEPETPSQTPPQQNASTPLPHLELEKITKVEGRIVSLTARSETVEDAILLILLGQKESRNNQSVTGAEVMDGLKHSGYAVERIDRVMDKLNDEGTIIAVGIHRGRRYRLSNTGLSKALIIAKEVIATVP